MKVIDVSHWQGYIDFNSVRASGIEGVIIKAGGSDAGFYKDSKFETNYVNAEGYFISKKDFLVVALSMRKRFIIKPAKLWKKQKESAKILM